MSTRLPIRVRGFDLPRRRPVRPALAAALLLAAALTALWSTQAPAAGYPKLALYGGINGNGYPFILGGNRTGPLDNAMCDSVSRYDEVILDASPISEYRPDVAAALRQRHPGISLLAYVLAEGIWPAMDADSLVHYPTRFHRFIRDIDGYLYDQSGGEYVQANVNMAKRDAQGRYVVAEGLADLFYDAIVQTGVWDGIFLDGLCEDIRWTENATAHIDYVRAGYGSLNTFAIGWKAGVDTLCNRLRRISGSSQILVGNCGQGTEYASLNGWMHENFPYQNGGDWISNMFRDPGGYFIDEARFRAPQHDYLFSAANPPTLPYTANNARVVRYGLASAALGSGYGVFGYSARAVGTYNYSGWWYDEYAVDLATGRSSPLLQHTGWLGQPLGPMTQMIWLTGNPDATAANPGFETDVTTGWAFTPNIPGTIARDAATAAVGGASAKINVPTAGVADWQVNLASTGGISVTAGVPCAATLWAKASAPRQIGVSIYFTGVGLVAYRAIDIATQWKRYQVMLTPSQSGTGNIHLSFAAAAGDVWVDDLHLQVGPSNLWRRDFQNGIVLVNPTFTPLTVPLERTFRKILGTVAPTVNNGGSTTQVSLGSEDALFLIGDDFIPPAPVTDMHPVPR